MDPYEKEYQRLKPTLFKWVRLSLFAKRLLCAGQDNLPQRGPAIIVGNHIGSYKDISTLLCISSRQLHFTANKEIFDKDRFNALIRHHLKQHLKEFGLLLDVAIRPIKLPFVNFISGNIGSVGSIPVDLAKGKTDALRQCEKYLHEGRVIVLLQGKGRINPKDPHPFMSEFRRGPAILSYNMYVKYGKVVPVVPVAMWGTHNPWVVPATIKVKVGSPLLITDFPMREFRAMVDLLRAAMQKRMRIMIYDLVNREISGAQRLK